LSTLAEFVPVGIYVTDPAGSCLYVNERWCELTGFSREEAAGDGWAQAVHPEDRDSTFRNWRRGRLEGKEFADEFRIQAPDGTVRVVSSRASPVLDEAGRLTGYLGAATDITELHSSQESLRELAHTFAIRVRELNCLFGISHLVEAAHGSLERILQGAVRLLPPSWQFPDIACARILMHGREYRTGNFVDSRWKLTAEILVRGERAGLLQVGYLEEREPACEGPFLAEERTLINTIAGRLGEIAEHMETADALRAREAELSERLRFFSRVNTMGQMATSIAHELNQPLTTISSFAEACRRRLGENMSGGPEVGALLTRITEEALRAGKIIHGLRELVEKRQSERVVCDVNELVQAVASLQAPDARLLEVPIMLSLSAPLPPVVADEIQLQQVVLNLVRNGLEAVASIDGGGPGDRWILVKTALNSDGEIQISVADSGPGLAELDAEQIFEPFFTTKDHGTGLGLAICRSIVISHGGRIWHQLDPQGHTVFSFTLPADTQDHDAL
jgi:PAS domain S-box-containing protein